MWAGPPDYSGTYDVEDSVAGFIPPAGRHYAQRSLGSEHRRNEMFIDFIGDKAVSACNTAVTSPLYSTKDGALTETHLKQKAANHFRRDRCFCPQCPNRREASLPILIPRYYRAHDAGALMIPLSSTGKFHWPDGGGTLTMKTVDLLIIFYMNGMRTITPAWIGPDQWRRVPCKICLGRCGQPHPDGK